MSGPYDFTNLERDIFIFIKSKLTQVIEKLIESASRIVQICRMDLILYVLLLAQMQIHN